MSQGWIKLHRQLNKNPIWFEEPFTKGQAWVDLVMNANHKDGRFFVRGIEVPIKRGQIGWSELTMASRWQWSKMKVRRYLKRLESDTQVRQQKIAKITTIITIINYERYQGDTTDETTNDTTDETQTRMIKNDKELGEAKASQELPTNSEKNMAWTPKHSDNDDDLPAIDMDSGEMKTPTKKSTAKYPHAPEVRKLFLEILGRNPSNWKINKNQLQACENLFTERGVDKVRSALEFYKEHQDDEYCPNVHSPFDLDSKWTKLGEFKLKL